MNILLIFWIPIALLFFVQKVRLRSGKTSRFTKLFAKKTFLSQINFIWVKRQEFLAFARSLLGATKKNNWKKNKKSVPQKWLNSSVKKHKIFSKIKDFRENWGFTDNFHNSIKNCFRHYIGSKFFLRFFEMSLSSRNIFGSYNWQKILEFEFL